MKLNKDIIQSVRVAASKAGGYLTTELYNKNRGSLPAWESLKGKLDNISFSDFLKQCDVLEKDEFLRNENRIKAISNLKLLGLEYGEISKSLYDNQKPKLSPSSDYISKYYGWDEIAKSANVKLANSRYLSLEDAVKELKQTIKDLGYIPTNAEYRDLNLKPSDKSLKSLDVTWSTAMRKAGYKPYGRVVSIKDKICVEHNCFSQFTPANEDEIYCERCYKLFRQRAINSLGDLDYITIKDFCKKLIYTSTNQKNLLNIFEGKLK
ncbi:hypothetical protein [Paenibacillus sp. GCM10012306]|uniref:hypothetical protein n=1 Tax=Paenibacillus sp. GCM10012306 TaxID=3317342 RepID=UPI00360B9A4C